MNALFHNKNAEAQQSRLSTSPQRAPEGAAADRMRQRFTLIVAMFGFAVVTLDAQATNVALPAIHHDLGGGLSGLQWIVTGYTLMFSALLLFGGSLADRIGSRNGYRTGMLVFILASAACGLSPSLPFLIGARIVQGIGAALLTPTCLSLIREAFLETNDRARAIAYWALGGSVAAAAGPVLGGLLIQVNWRLIFFVNLPVGVAALIALNRVAPSTKHRVRFDWTGQVAAVVGLGGITFGVIRGGAIGFGSTQVEVALVVGILSLIGFCPQRSAHQPCNVATGTLQVPNHLTDPGSCLHHHGVLLRSGVPAESVFSGTTGKVAD